MAQKFYTFDFANKLFKLFEALVTSTGAPDAGRIVATDAGGKIDPTLMPAGIGAVVKSAVASEALASGNIVNLYSNAGTINARKADATAYGKRAIGYVTAGVASAASASVYTNPGIITGLSGLTPGADYFLDSATPGGISLTPPDPNLPANAGKIIQFVGTALSATELDFAPDVAVTIS